METSTVGGATAELAADLYRRTADGLPEVVAQTAKSVVLDGLGCLLAGLAETPSRIVREYVAAAAGRPEATVAGLRGQIDAAGAAYANAVAIHALDFDAIGNPACHSTASVLPALIALAERAGATGRDLLRAFVLGWEVECRLRTAGTLRAAFHPLSVYGPVASAAGCAVLLGLEAPRIETAIAIGASAAGGLAANGQTPVKVVHAGNAARAGLLAALQAQQGLAAATNVFERTGGYGDAFFAQIDWAGLNARDSREYFLDPNGVAFKPYPVQLPMLGLIDVVLDVRPAEFNLAELDTLELDVSPLVASRSNPRPRSGHGAKFSPEYCAAIALRSGRLDIASFSDALVHEPQVLDAMDRVTITAVANFDTHRSVARLRTRNGKVLEVSRHQQRGSSADPLSRAQRIAKVRSCLAYARKAELTDDLVECVEGLETASDVSRLCTLLRSGGTE